MMCGPLLSESQVEPGFNMPLTVFDTLFFQCVRNSTILRIVIAPECTGKMGVSRLKTLWWIYEKAATVFQVML